MPTPSPRNSFPRSRIRFGAPYLADGVEAVRVLVLNSALSQKEIARRTGISLGTVQRWIRQRNWVRPRAAPVSHGSVALYRATPARRLKHLARRAEALAGRYLSEAETRGEAEAAALGRAGALREAAAGMARRATARPASTDGRRPASKGRQEAGA
jgi:transcriptional regulator with XRE-family HTH domain